MASNIKNAVGKNQFITLLNNLYSKDKSYDGLFSSWGYPVKQNKSATSWTLSKQPPKVCEITTLANDIIAHLLENQQNTPIISPAELAIRINKLITPSLLTAPYKADWKPTTNSSLEFNSKVKELNFLSNLFPSLLALDVEDGDGKTPKLYSSAENAYQAWQMRHLDEITLSETITCGTDPKKAQKTAAKFKKNLHASSNIGEYSSYGLENDQKKALILSANSGGSEIDFEQKESFLGELGCEDSVKAPISDDDKIEKMRQIIKAKFNQNPLLRTKLIQTAEYELVEITKSELWGSGSQGTGQNQMGKLLMEQRALLARKA